MTDYRSIPPPEPDEEFVIAIRPLNPTEGEMMIQVLRDHDIECRLIGTRDAALIGVPQHVLPLRIEVPSSQLKPARELLAEMRPPRSDDDEELPRPRRPILAAGCVLLFFGGSHMYARRPWTAAVLGITQLGALFLRGSWPNGEIKVGAISTVLLLDVVMGVRATSAYNRGVRLTPIRQALVGLAWAITAALVGVLYALITAK